MADQKSLEDLHDLLAKTLLEKVKEGSCLAVARQFLKDNGIDAPSEGTEPLHSLVEELPFSDPGEQQAS